jgi:polyhydroxybutyrate depolymerase
MLFAHPTLNRHVLLWCRALLVLALVLIAGLAEARVEKVERKLKVGNLERSYIAFVPDGARTAREVPVLFAFHPGFGTASAFVDQVKIHQAPGAADFIVVYPDGFRRSWNSGDCCGPAQRRNIDDVAFVKAMFEDLKQFGNISPSRNFATGFSNGFAFSQQLACSMPDRFAAIAGGGGVKDPSRGCGGAQPISVLIMHGLIDEYSPYAGGESVLEKAGYRVSVATLEDFWSRTSRCSATRTVSKLGGISCTSHTGCASGTEVTICPIPELGHWWPGHTPRRDAAERTLGPARGDLDGSAEVVRFFRSKL